MGSERIAGVLILALPLPGLNTFDSVSSFVIVPSYYHDRAIMMSERINVHNIPKHDLQISAMITICP